MFSRLAGLVLVATVVGCASFGPVFGQGPTPPLTGDFSVLATSSLGNATFIADPSGWAEPYTWLDSETGKWHTSYYWDSVGETALTTEGGGIIGYVESLNIGIDEDPAVSVSFSCRAGAVDTVFTISSFLSTSLLSPTGLASASITAQDRNSDGVIVTGLLDGGNCYQATYNAGPTLFASMVPGGSATAGHIYSSGSYDYGPVSVGEPVSYMEGKYNFTLSAQDTAAGVSNFQLEDPAPATPEPGSLVALCGGFVGLIGLARRRRG